MQQGLGGDDQSASRLTGQQHTVEYEPRLDRLTEPDFVREQDSRGVAPGDFGRNVELMRDERHTRTDQAQDGRAGLAYALQPGPIAQAEREA